MVSFLFCIYELSALYRIAEIDAMRPEEGNKKSGLLGYKV